MGDTSNNTQRKPTKAFKRNEEQSRLTLVEGLEHRFSTWTHPLIGHYEHYSLVSRPEKTGYPFLVEECENNLD